MDNFRDGIIQFFRSFLSGGGLNLAKAAAVLVLGVLFIRLLTFAVRKRAVKSRRLDNAASSFVTSLVALVAGVALVLALIGAL